MKTLFFSMAFLLASFFTITAQDFYLPVSTTSETAKAAYYKTEAFAANVQFKEAKAQFDMAVAEDPKFFMAYVSNIYYSSGENKAAMIDKALAIDPSNFTEAEKIVRKQLVIWDKDPEAKIAENMKALIAAYPQTPQAYHWASLHAAYTDKDADASLKYAEKLAELSPDFAPNYNTLGYMYIGKKQMKKAKAALEKYITLLPNEANPYDSMAEYYMINKEYAKSAEYYDKAVEMGMTSAKERAEKAREMMSK